MSLASLQAYKSYLRTKKITKQISKVNNSEIDKYIDNLRQELNMVEEK